MIEAHRLLKNSISIKPYFLLTESVFNANIGKFKGTCYYSGSQLCEVYGNLKKIGYAYFDHEEDKEAGTISSVDDYLENKSRLSFV